MASAGYASDLAEMMLVLGNQIRVDLGWDAPPEEGSGSGAGR